MNGIDSYLSLLKDYGISPTELILAAILLIVGFLAYLVAMQKGKYLRLQTAIRRCSDELKKQERLMGDIEANIKKYESTSSAAEVEHWSKIGKELEALADLPRLEETDEEVILKTYIAQSRKDYVDVSATKESVIISINDEKGMPVEVIYGIPIMIDPQKLIVTYRGNTLEVHAPKESMKSTGKLGRKAKDEAR